MITRITGIVNRILDEEARLQIGPYERQILVPDFVRRQLQNLLAQEVTLHTTEYLEGSQMSTRLIPRLIGFLHEQDMDFFDLFCTVEKIGVRKALKALARPIHEIAGAIQRQDTKWLSTLPGIGAKTAEQIVASLRRNVTRYTVAPATEGTAANPNPVVGTLMEDIYNALMSVGHSPTDARTLLDQLIAGGKAFTTIEEGLQLIYSRNA
jgi:Holliday junction DNA helicase RuvA